MVKFDNRVIRLISFQNIRPELEAGELDAWRKLMRIQRHEIINSITPITTLTTAIKRCFMQGRARKELNDVTVENIDDALSSVAVIEDRSLGLLDFVERFRSLTDLPVPKIAKTPFRNLTDPLLALFSRELKDRKIGFKVAIEPENLVVSADEKLLEQVLINVLKNALEAIRSPGGEIMLRAYTDRQYHVVIEIADNGIGIEEAALESVFIPSYTTKENGSGIGLSLSRQIIQLHGGTITVRSQPGVSTVFVITLPNALNTP
jgi:signal transduction histidine kinase